VDGFYVCKLKKTGPSPQQKPGEANGAANGATNGDDDVPIDKTPIGEEEAEFGGWDEDEDQAYIEKAKKRNLKRKGLNPKSDKSAAAGKANGKST
jgi:ribosomal RNA methyltransferase Nop2